VNVNKEERSIDFEIVGMKGTRRPQAKDRPKVIIAGKGRKDSNQKANRNGSGKENDKDKDGDWSTRPPRKKKKKHYE
ncbi:hypothetical protein, partial [Shouchella clausii]|uniref:hypothetical protein n=1 Tax=Shouchella clausii TaxID=79880 RepID=UPI0011608821